MSLEYRIGDVPHRRRRNGPRMTFLCVVVFVAATWGLLYAIRGRQQDRP